MSRSDARLYGNQPRPAGTYRAARSNDAKYPQRCEVLRAERIRRGITRRELDHERFMLAQEAWHHQGTSAT